MKFHDYYVLREDWSTYGGVSEKEFTLNTDIGPVTYRVQSSIKPASAFPKIRAALPNGPYDNRWQCTKFDFGVKKGSATDYRITNLNNGTAVMRNVIAALQEYMANERNKTPLAIIEAFGDNLDSRMSAYLSMTMRYAKPLGYSPLVLDDKTILLLNHKILETPQEDIGWLDQHGKELVSQWRADKRT